MQKNWKGSPSLTDWPAEEKVAWHIVGLVVGEREYNGEPSYDLPSIYLPTFYITTSDCTYFKISNIPL